MSPPEPWSDDLAAATTLVRAAYSYRSVRRRIRLGAWQELLPGVVLRTTGTPTERQWQRAALLYAGAGAALSHATAAARWGLPVRAARVVVTRPGGSHPRSTERVWVRQSTRSYRVLPLDGLATTAPARSVLDAALDLDQLRDVDDLFGRAFQRGLISVAALASELDAAPSAGSRLPRLALAEVAAGSHAASEAQLLRLLRKAGLPLPELNAALATRAGTKYVDALWRSLGKGVEVDGRAYHLGPRQWQADLQRQNAVQSAGVVLLRVAARRLWTEPDAVVREIRIFLRLPSAS